MSSDDYQRYDNVRCLKATDDAALILFDDGEKHWVPWSVTEDNGPSDVRAENEQGSIHIKTWWCEKKGWL